MRHLLPAIDPVGHITKHLIAPLKTSLDLLFRIEGLNDTQTAQRLLNLAHQQAPLLLPLERLTFQLLADLPHDITRQWQQDQDKKRQLPADRDHSDQIDNDQDRVLEQHIQRAHDRGLNLVHVARDPSDDIAFPLLGEEAQRQLRDLPVDLVADIPYDTCPDRDHRKESHIHRRDFQESGHDKENAQDNQGERATVVVDHIRNVPEEIIHPNIGQPLQGLPITEIKMPILIDIIGLVDLEQDLQNRDDQSEREQVQNRGKHVEHDVPDHVSLVRRHKTPQHLDEISHKNGIITIYGAKITYSSLPKER